MTSVTTGDLIAAATAALRPRRVGDVYVADVGAALLARDGGIFTGASVGGYLGLCAEQGAMSALVSEADPVVSSLVAVWRDEEGTVFVLPPCGRCREFLRVLSQDNLDARVILGPDHVVPLRDLLPFAGWYAERS